MKAPKIQKDTLRKVLRYIRPYWALVGISILLAAVTVAASLYIPILTGGAVDLIVGPGNVDFAGILQILLQHRRGHRPGGSVPVGDEPDQQPDHLPGGAGHPQRGLPQNPDPAL